MLDINRIVYCYIWLSFVFQSTRLMSAWAKFKQADEAGLKFIATQSFMLLAKQSWGNWQKERLVFTSDGVGIVSGVILKSAYDLVNIKNQSR